MNYSIPAQLTVSELEVKKSRFIAYAGHVADRAMAMALLDDIKARYPDARHHCWAYQLGNPASPVSAAMSDDGEPSGTAGKPILNVLQHKAVGDVMVVVVRYFGGIKLGAGGLVRAYSGAAQQVMEQLPLHTQVALSAVRVSSDFKHEQFIRHFVQQHNGNIADVQYGERVTMTASLPAPDLPALQEATGGMDVQLSNEEN
ncbi:YigZ family protein [Alteromonas sp. CYL-A6]|uniref:YigZ family protein n=1 Tax=Alteromonas nitratireducens TaxID=3390813 RepID=UPI0034BC65BB